MFATGVAYEILEMNPCQRKRCLALKGKTQFGEEEQEVAYLISKRTLIRIPKIFQITKEAESRKL